MDLQELKTELPEIFKQVKKDVRKVLGRNVHRAGLSLGLVEMGMFQGGFIGGMHFAPGTDIVMNKTPLKIILSSQPYEVVWAYVYHILLHEYIHSLGIINEHICREKTLEVSKEIFKEADHPAIILAEKGIGFFIPNLKITYIPPEMRPDGLLIEYISNFDQDSMTYYS
ncbi:MAG: hypothetical protein EAX89_01450 [Candidatus Lokiarchaeota archaeon]|nr:hypothetical protein [Candidatus Lokiarchaeota archaeon]